MLTIILPIVSICCLATQPTPPVPFLRTGVLIPPTLDLRDALPETLVPKNILNEQEIEDVRNAWLQIVQPYKGFGDIQLKLPSGDGRLPILLAASQALRAQNPAIKVYLSYDETAPPNWDESFWGSLDGGILLPENLSLQPENWIGTLIKAQSQLPARPWTIWCPSDPGKELPLLLSNQALLVVPADGHAATLLKMIPSGFIEIDGEPGRLTLRNATGQQALHWQFTENGWEKTIPEDESNAFVVVEGKADYDVHALLAKVRATQLRDSSALKTQQSQLSVNIHAQSDRGVGGDLGYIFSFFENTGEPEEFLQEKILVNGVKANISGQFQLPIIESKRSISPPVALNLTERYRYSDGGPEGVGKRWIRFTPSVDDPTLFTGQILVAEESGRILEERSERSNLPGIIKSEKRKLTYGEPAPGYWRVMNIQTFERWVLSGGVAQVQRDHIYTGFLINQDDFFYNRQQARDSKSTMMRQTEDGVRYLVRDKDGNRYIEHKQRTFGRAIGGAVLVDPSLQFPVIPAAALALFDYDAFGKGIQYNALIAGVYNMGTLTIPDLAGFALGIHAQGGILAFTERPVKDGELLDEDGVARQSAQVRLSIGRDLGYGFRMRLQGLGIYNRFSDAKEEKYRTPDYLIPPSGFTLGWTGELTWMHKGFQLRGNYGSGKRPDGFFGSPGDIRPIAEGGKYTRWGMTTAYDLRLNSLSWIHSEIGMDGGSGFDRFQSLELGGMGGGVRVAGIRSNAVTADKIHYASMGFVFPAAASFRFSCHLDHARAHSLDDKKTYGFTGLGLAGDIPGFWWFTTVRADIGIGIQSDVPGVRGVNGYIALLRVF
ncbi:MAG: hypothetical protein FWG02_01895 [Holophagaceae bacterium]|nr:hypothetical protein [Holophagaceae bacterium]